MSLEKEFGIQILYEDNHLIALNKRVSDIVQGDKTGDVSLDRTLEEFIRRRDNKPGNVFVGVPHRLDRPVSGVVVFAKTGKALSRMAQLFREKGVEKVYHAVVEQRPDPPEGRLEHFMTRNERRNKSYCHNTEVKDSKLAVLSYRLLTSLDRYHLVEVHLETGRHHQIRAQLSAIGCPVKGDVKYGARRPNRNKGISLHARRIAFIHPVRKEPLEIVAPFPEDDIFMSGDIRTEGTSHG
jgi:23S rRNA pseudouridine1911/1915/1917 synthase